MASPLNLERGFLPSPDPLQTLPPDFVAWEALATQLPKLLVSGQFREHLHRLPAFPWEKLTFSAELERAMLLLSFLGHAYVWGCQPLVTQIPALLARPWCTLANKLGRPPVLSYASYALHNWFRINPQRPIELSNIALLQNFLGGVDEEWFVLVHVDIEAKAGQALQALLPAQQAAQNKQAQLLLAYLGEIIQGLKNMCNTLDRMPERCDPYIYFNRVRPYIHAWKNNPALPQGMIYEGCFNNQPQFFRGETGAQSSIIPCLDACFGISHHEDDLSIYLKEMRLYMPPEHRAFLETLEAQPSIRSYIQEHYTELSELRELYNQGIDLMVRFRMTHLKYAASYIHKQSQQASTNPNAVGTGGTPFMTYLAKHEKESEGFKI